MKIAGLFAGIGGFEVGLHRAGHQTSFLCEIKPEASKILAEKFPGVEIAADITKVRALPSDIDVVCGGFPCQDLSQAGRTSGLDGDNSGLIYQVFRLLNRKPRVPWVILENVPFMLQLNGGYAMREILDHLETLGYRWAYRVVDSFSFGLPQRRERVFIVASLDGHPEDVLLTDDAPIERPSTDLKHFAHGFYWTEGTSGLGWAVDSVPTLKNGSTIGIPSPPAILMQSGLIIKPDVRDAERMQGFEVDWTLAAESISRSSSRWSLIGSAVSVPISTWIGTRLSSPGRFDGGRCVDFPDVGKLPKAALGDVTGRCGVEVSVDPLGIRPDHLSSFLQFDGVPLSVRATEGFYNRALKARLRFADGFLDSVARHLSNVSLRERRSLELA